MKRRRKKLEPKLALNMSFGELLERLVQTKPGEVEASIRRAKQKNPTVRAKTKGPAKRRPRRPKVTSR